jgi:signal transduction histidine kinase/response regulator RpfG family c-di-GMP phosphodiesterase
MALPIQSNGSAPADEKVNILIVDDRPDKLLAHETILADLDQNLVRATSGREALRCLLQQDFAVILLDVNMPGMDGFETAALIRQRPRSETTPIIFISAVNDTDTHVSRGYSLGAVDYILTPVVPEILRAKLAVFVDLYKKTEQIKRQAEERATFFREQSARAEAEARQERLGFLADASNVLAGSLDFEETFENLARLVAPRLADFCVIEIGDEEGALYEVAIAHRDPHEESKLSQADAPDPIARLARCAGARVYQSGQSELCCKVDDKILNQLFAQEVDRDLIRQSLPAAFIAVPIRGRGGVLGAMTLVNYCLERACGPNELSLAEELGQRAALALENAQLYKAAQKALSEAERANLAKDRFLAMLSHELRTPLTPVLTSVLALESDENISSEARDSLQMIRRNVELEARLIDDLLDLTKISKGKVQLCLQHVDAHLLLRSALDICQSEIGNKHLKLETDLAASKVDLLADPARLQQIFWNLIKNAVKFTPEYGSLTIATANDEDGLLRVRIADSGVGIDVESLPKIFKAFEQGERTKMGGLGLGLAITKALVETHDGRITAESAGRGKGATFTAYFPLAERTDAQVIRSVPLSDSARKSMRILLVEDHEDTNRSLTNLLRRRGYHVQSANSVSSALQSAAEESFDLLISDIGLPDGTGIELMEKLNTEHSMVGIALTGFGMEDDVRKSRAVGFREHLVKPVDLNKLDSVLQEFALSR